MAQEIFEDLSIPEDIDEIEVLLSGTIDATTNISGQTIQIQSGTTVQLPSTQVVKISGEQVVLASGHIGSVGITDDGGVSVVEVTSFPNSDGRTPAVASLGTTGFLMSYDDDADRYNRLRVNKSGQGVLVVASSGIDYVSLGDSGGQILGVAASIDGIAVSNRRLRTVAALVGYEEDGDKWNRVRVNKSGQGALVVASSGLDHVVIGDGNGSVDTAFTTGDGRAGVRSLAMLSQLYGYERDGAEWNRVLLNKSGQGALVVASSGVDHINTKYEEPTALVAGYTQLTNVSGGLVLGAAQATESISMTNPNTSGKIWINQSGLAADSIGFLIKYDDPPVNLRIDNVNKIYAIAEMSGDYISYLGEVA